jgi:hypothetical protein
MASATRPRSPAAWASSSDGLRLLLALGAVLASGCHGCNDTTPPSCDPTTSTAQVGGIWTIEGEGSRAACADPRHTGSFTLGPSINLAVEQYSQAIPLEAGVEAGLPDASPPDRSVLDGRGREASAREASLPDLARDLGKAVGGTEAGLALDRGRSDGRRDGRAADRAADRAKPDRGPRQSYRYLLRLRSGPAGFNLSGEVRGSCVTFETQEQDPNGGLRYLFTGKASSRKIEGRFTGDGPQGCLSSGTFTVDIY